MSRKRRSAEDRNRRRGGWSVELRRKRDEGCLSPAPAEVSQHQLAFNYQENAYTKELHVSSICKFYHYFGYIFILNFFIKFFILWPVRQAICKFIFTFCL